MSRTYLDAVRSPEDLAWLDQVDIDVKPINLVWVDVETTGLDAANDLLLEIAVVVTDADLNELHAESWVLYGEINLAGLDSTILDMHYDNGLLREVVRSPNALDDITGDLQRIITSAELFPSLPTPLNGSRPVLCGSSVQFDREWLNVWFPSFASKLHYRNIDVSTIKELNKRWARGHQFTPPDDKPHRAMPDVRLSIEELRFYRGLLWNQTSP